MQQCNSFFLVRSRTDYLRTVSYFISLEFNFSLGKHVRGKGDIISEALPVSPCWQNASCRKWALFSSHGSAFQDVTLKGVWCEYENIF